MVQYALSGVLPVGSRNQTTTISALDDVDDYVIQRVLVMSTWEEGLAVRANSVRLRENNLAIQEKPIRLLENRCDTLLCKICLVHDSDVLLVPCMHIYILSTMSRSC